MIIHVVQPGETVNSIADMYGVTVAKLVQDNELTNPTNLVPGQTIVIAHPEQTHIVQEGDTLNGIADAYGITLMQLLINNPFLTGREFIYPGETIVIRYNTTAKTTTFGYCYPFINETILRKTLPGLTYLTIVNYRATREGSITSFYDDTDIVRIATEYNTLCLAMITTLSPQGEPDFEVAYQLLLNENYQNIQLDNIITILQAKGYYGANFVFNFMNRDNLQLYNNFITKAVSRLGNLGYLTFVTINPNITNENNEILFEQIDYSHISQLVDGIIFLQFIWGTNYGPPSPVSSISNLKAFTEYAISYVPPDKFNIGKPVFAYNWALPYIPNRSNAYSLTINAALSLASDYSATIQLDEISQTPYYRYIQSSGFPDEHIVWSLDARSIQALLQLVSEYNLNGIGIWNIMDYVPQLWLLIRSEFEIAKILTDT